MTAGGNNDADMATPTKEPALPPSIDSATPAPEGTATITPTYKLRKAPLQEEEDLCPTKRLSFLNNSNWFVYLITLFRVVR